MNTQATEVIELSPDEQETRHALGTILIEAGLIGTHDVDRIQRFARERGMKFGDAAVALNVARQEDVDFALGQQFAYPTLARGGPDGVGQDVVAAYAPQSQAIEPNAGGNQPGAGRGTQLAGGQPGNRVCADRPADAAD
jgi:receptor protein-tyrosine kinase